MMKEGSLKYIVLFFHLLSESWANSLMMTISKSRSMSASCAAYNHLYSQTLARSGLCDGTFSFFNFFVKNTQLGRNNDWLVILILMVGGLEILNEDSLRGYGK